MANPQIEDGYTSIANELLEAIIKVNLSPYETRILLGIMRKTYGYHKKSDHISLSQLEQLTNIPRVNICRTLNHLVKRQMIVKSFNNSRTTEWSVQKNYTVWCIPTDTISDDNVPEDSVSTESISTDNGIVSPQIMGSVSTATIDSVSRDNKVVSPEIHTKESKDTIKDTITKDTIQKKEPATRESVRTIFFSFIDNERYKTIDFENEYAKFCEYWFDGKRKLKLVKLACHNWLDHVLTFKNNGWSKQSSRQPLKSGEDLAKDNEEFFNQQRGVENV
jgi:phage replication O-like protein O